MADPSAHHKDTLVRVAGAAALVIGCVVLFGWATDVIVLKCVLPGLAAMKPNSAVAFVLAGASLLALRAGLGPRLRLAATTCALLVALLGALTLLQHVTGID